MSRHFPLTFTGLSLAALLCACSTPPVREAVTSRAGTESTQAQQPPRKPTVVQKRGGAYYKDDGPGDEIPDNLDDIPDAVPRIEALHRFANRPYVVLGKSYVPDTRLKAFRQRGVASWYGKKFHGQKTSIGEPYDMFSMTAAHPTMAIPSYARVTNVSNGRSVVVRVTDRGPFHADRIIDLSYAAAHRLGYVNNGSTLVEVEAALPGESTAFSYVQSVPPLPVAKPAPPPTVERDEIEALAARLAAAETAALSKSEPSAATGPASALTDGSYLQMGAFSNADNAESLRAHLARELDWIGEEFSVRSSGGWHRVHLGPYKDRTDAELVAEKIRNALGYKPALVGRR